MGTGLGDIHGGGRDGDKAGEIRGLGWRKKERDLYPQRWRDGDRDGSRDG